MKYYISDLHLGHKNIIILDSRPFADSDEMFDTMLRSWNSAVSPQDEVYILGDFAWKNSVGLSFLQQAKGRKFLILGNHDKPNAEMKQYFEWIKDYAVIKDGETEVVLFHYPIAAWDSQFHGTVHLYGHVHDNRDYEAFLRYLEICEEMDIPHECFNVGCMLPYMGYTPRTLEEIRGHGRVGGVTKA